MTTAVATKYVCSCGGGMSKMEYLTAHIAKPGFWGVGGIHELLGIPERTHRPIGEVSDYPTEMGADAYFKQKSEWRASLRAKNGNSLHLLGNRRVNLYLVQAG